MKRKDTITIIVLITCGILFLAGTLAINPLFPVEETFIPIDFGEMPTLSNSREGTIPGAPVTVEAYIDYQCPHCGGLVQVLERIMTVYGRNVNVIIRHFPQYEDSMIAAQGVECARLQGTFWGYHRTLHEHPDKLKAPNLIIYADQLGLDTKEFTACIEEGSTIPEIMTDKGLAEERLVTGTPTVFINGWEIEGLKTFGDYKEKIDLVMRS